MVKASRDNPGHRAEMASRNDTTVFTPSGASKTLPLVRRIVSELMGLQSLIDAQREQLRGIDALTETIDSRTYQEEVEDVRDSLEDDQQQMQACIDELESFGVVVHEPFDGFVDFPAVLNRRPIRLCWHPADERVNHYHELHQSPSDRKKLDDAVIDASAIGWAGSC